MKLLNVGSVITVNSIDLIILGYTITTDEENDKYLFCYNVGLFPVGVIPGKDSVGCLDATKEYEVKFQGYSDKLSESYISKYEEKIDSLSKVKPSDVNAFMELLVKKMEEKNNE